VVPDLREPVPVYGHPTAGSECLLLHPVVGRMAGVSDPPAPGAQQPPDRGHRMPIDRAVILLGLFILATVLLLGQIHATPAASTATSGGSPTTATTVPGATTTTRPPTTTTTSPVKIKPTTAPVLVANASGVPGAAATITNQLQVAGYNVQAPINATANVSTSAVYYVVGKKAGAIQVAATLHIPASAVLPYTTAAPVSTIGTAEILVVVAPDVASSLGTTTTAAS